MLWRYHACCTPRGYEVIDWFIYVCILRILLLNYKFSITIFLHFFKYICINLYASGYWKLVNQRSTSFIFFLLLLFECFSISFFFLLLFNYILWNQSLNTWAKREILKIMKCIRIEQLGLDLDATTLLIKSMFNKQFEAFF